LSQLTITLPDGSTKSVPRATTVGDIAASISPRLAQAAYAGMVAKYAIEHWTRIPCEVELSHEFRYRDPILTKTTLVVAISQSGETADTMGAIRYALSGPRAVPAPGVVA